MNKDVLITEIAKKDIIEIADYIAKDNKFSSLAIIDNFYKVFELLSEFPEAGTHKSAISDKTVRIYTMRKNFAIVYRIHNDKIEILRILSRYQNILAILT